MSETTKIPQKKMLAQRLADRDEEIPAVNDGKAALSAIFKKPGLFFGQVKTYTPRTETARPEERETIPTEEERIQARSWQIIGELRDLYSPLMNTVAAIETANTKAHADVYLNGTIILHEKPVSYLMWLKKQLGNLEELLKEWPTLPTAIRWEWDTNEQCYRAARPTVTSRTKKVPYAFELAKPTAQHPGQYLEKTEDREIGTYETLRKSAALPSPVREEIVKRVAKLRMAVSDAIQDANVIVAEPVEVASPIFDYLFEPASLERLQGSST